MLTNQEKYCTCLLPSDVLCCQQQSSPDAPSGPWSYPWSILYLWFTWVLWLIQWSHNRGINQVWADMSEFMVTSHLPHCRVSDNVQQGHPLQNHVLEAPDAVDSWWFFTWWSTATSSRLSGNKRISCESQVHKKKKKPTQNHRLTGHPGTAPAPAHSWGCGLDVADGSIFLYTVLFQRKRYLS